MTSGLGQIISGKNMTISKIFSVIILFALASCGQVSIPASGMTSDGSQWTGYFTLSEFQIAGNGVICTGTPPMGMETVQTASFTCDDGRTGTITTNRTSMRGGTIAAQFSDGTTGSFAYGS